MTDSTNKSDGLLERTKAGDRDALGTLLVRHHKKLVQVIEEELGVAMRRKIEPEDVVARVFDVVFRKIDGFEGDSDKDFFAWLKTIAKYQTLDEIRKVNRKKRGGDRNRISVGDAKSGSAAAPSLGALQPDSASPSRHAAHQELHEALARAVKYLNPTEQQVFQLRFYDQREWDDIATATNRTKSAVRAVYRRSLDKVKEQLGQLSRFLST